MKRPARRTLFQDSGEGAALEALRARAEPDPSAVRLARLCERAELDGRKVITLLHDELLPATEQSHHAVLRFVEGVPTEFFPTARWDKNAVPAGCTPFLINVTDVREALRRWAGARGS